LNLTSRDMVLSCGRVEQGRWSLLDGPIGHRPRGELCWDGTRHDGVGIATGATIWAACRGARLAGARKVVVAVDVGPPRWTAGLRRVADEMVCIDTPAPFYAVSEWYRDFADVADAEVTDYLARNPRSRRSPGPARPEARAWGKLSGGRAPEPGRRPNGRRSADGHAKELPDAEGDRHGHRAAADQAEHSDAGG
jgi:hypothetical protein